MAKEKKKPVAKKISKFEYVQLQAMVIASNSQQKFYEEYLAYSKQVIDKLLEYNNLSVEK